jgi:hypothetical protein
MPTPDLYHRFAYHPPSRDDVRQNHELVRAECYRLAQILDALPDGREKALALTKIEEVMFWANAAIARNQ